MENELAIAFLLGLSTEEQGEPKTLLKAYYPFRVYTINSDRIVLDLLGYSESSKNLLIPKDLSFFLDEFAKLENGADKQLWLKTAISLIGDDQNYETVSVKGLVEQEEIVKYLLESSKSGEGEPNIFKPIYTSRNFGATKRKLKKTQTEILERIEKTENIKKRIETIEDTIKDEHGNHIESHQKESNEKNENLLEEKDKAFKVIDETLKKENKAIEEKTQAEIKSKQLKIEEINKEITDLEQRASEGERDARRALGDQRKTVRQLSREIQEYEKELSNQITENEKKAESEKTEWEKKIQDHNKQSETRLAELVEKQNTTIDTCAKVNEKIGELVNTLEDDLRKISCLIDINYKDGETIYLPFYLFQYEKGYGHNPPVKMSSESSVKKTLLRILAGNLGQRLEQKIQPQTKAFNKLLDKVTENLEDTTLSKQIDEKIAELNILENREKLDRIEVGLYQFMETEWINEKDYLFAQRFMVHQLDKLNGGNFFTKTEPIPEPEETDENTDETEAK